MNTIKKICNLIIFLFLYLQGLSQLLENTPFYRSYELQVYLDTLTHTNIKPYKYQYKVDTNQYNIKFSPFFYANSAYDISQDHFSFNYQGGIHFGRNI